jgi:flagellin
MRLMHNIPSLNIYRQHVENLKDQSTGIQRISSGYKYMKAGDNPNALAKSEKLRFEIKARQIAARNLQDSNSFIQTAETGMKGINESLLRIRELLVQSGGACDKDEKDAIQNEINEMTDNIEKLSQDTRFNGVSILSSSKKIITQIGALPGEFTEICSQDLTPVGLNIDGNKISVNDLDNSLITVDDALDKVISSRSKYGAMQNIFESASNNMIELSDNTQKAESGIRDADIAEEMMGLAKSNLLIEAGNAMMVQTNQFPKDILRILENVRSR